ncbi:MAG: hypothetical protein AAF212_03230 [Verrucomicrobiota bacterium]
MCRQDYLERSPVYDYNEDRLSNTDTVPGFNSKEQPIKITGTIFLSDGVTPAKDVILYIEQADENGDFDLRFENEKRYVHNRGWVKTDANGAYTFYTYIPGNDRRYNQLQQLYPIVKAPNENEVEMTTFLFEGDPLLTKSCRKRIEKHSNTSRILKPKKVDGMLTAQRDIVLGLETVK